MNTGCIPTKALVRSAEIIHAARSASKFGARVPTVEVDFAAIMARKNRIVGEIIRRMEAGLRGNERMEVVMGDARFRSPAELEVEGRVLGAPKMVVATGSGPIVPSLPGLDGARYVTSNEIVDLPELPRRLVVLGGGAVACEYGQMFRRFGAEVTMLVRGPRLISREDHESAAVLAEVFREEGIRLEVNTTVTRVEKIRGGQRVLARTGDAERGFECDLILVAIGRAPNVAGLELEKAGVSYDARGIQVDKNLRTTAPHIWAAGDCTGGLMFTHVAVYEGVRAASNALGESYEADEFAAPRAIFTDPEVAGVGLTEEEALRRGHRIKVAKQPMSNVGRARVMEETHGHIKFVLDAEDDSILGCHVIAVHGAEVLHPAIVAMNVAGRSLDPIFSSIFIHPTLTEGLQSAAEASFLAVPRMTH